MGHGGWRVPVSTGQCEAKCREQTGWRHRLSDQWNSCTSSMAFRSLVARIHPVSIANSLLGIKTGVPFSSNQRKLSEMNGRVELQEEMEKPQRET